MVRKSHFGPMFRRYRSASALPLRKLAAQVGIDKSRLSRWEQGKADLPSEEIARLNQALYAHRELTMSRADQYSLTEDSIGSNVELFRSACGWTREMLAQRIGMNTSALVRLEQTKKPLPTGLRSRINAVLQPVMKKMEADQPKIEARLSPEMAAEIREKVRERLETNPQSYMDGLARLYAFGQALDVPVPPVQDHRSEEVKAHVETMERLIENQSKLIELYSSLTAGKDARILELEKQVADLRALYDAETDAALAYDKARGLREKLTVPVPDDNKE